MTPIYEASFAAYLLNRIKYEKLDLLGEFDGVRENE